MRFRVLNWPLLFPYLCRGFWFERVAIDSRFELKRVELMAPPHRRSDPEGRGFGGGLAYAGGIWPLPVTSVDLEGDQVTWSSLPFDPSYPCSPLLQGFGLFVPIFISV